METFVICLDQSVRLYQENISKIQQDLGVSVVCAYSIGYLRSRSRWYQALEEELVRRYKAGEPQPNIYEWHSEPERQKLTRGFS